MPLERIAAIKEKIEELLFLYKIDVVGFNRVSDDFRAVALQHIKVI